MVLRLLTGSVEYLDGLKTYVRNLYVFKNIEWSDNILKELNWKVQIVTYNCTKHLQKVDNLETSCIKAQRADNQISTALTNYYKVVEAVHHYIVDYCESLRTDSYWLRCNGYEQFK